ncbi:hypothetical protein GWK41_06420 [Persephonella atlantica]|uniref:PepSY domain-containing protein n=1 Tax=Persephonella atlantica TaxID=2699429 RepID=A0ABS1GIG2_9AQUI|nr:hypothetical protein [Persephonella atlantica]MBK3332698.1 hypothetical protein [Persephonella atlantica]
MRKIFFILVVLVPVIALSFPFNHMGQGNTEVPLNIQKDSSSEQMMGCIGDCAACHSLTPIEAQSILGQKFDVKKVLSIAIKNGYFEVEYETSDGKKEKINLFFSKDKACREVIHLNE